MYPVRSRLFWYAGATRPEGDPAGGRKRDLLSIFGDWPEAVPELIEPPRRRSSTVRTSTTATR